MVLVITGFDLDSFVNVDKNKVQRLIGPVSGNMIPFRAESDQKKSLIEVTIESTTILTIIY